jgi:hypothetical protein
MLFYNSSKEKPHEDCHFSMWRFIPSFVLCLGGLLMTSCLPAETIPPTQTPLPSDTPPPTSTMIWFPPSATPTPMVVFTPTAAPRMNPGIGAVLLADDFSDDTAWDVAASAQGSVAIARNRLTLAAEPGVYLVSMNRGAVFGDFYAEITARPSLCRRDDSYGVIIRSTGDAFYRFTLNCNGMTSAERVKNGVRLLVQEPTLSGDAPLGAPGEVRIGIWAAGGEMRLFLNDRFQFDIRDTASPRGSFGVFVRGAGDTPVSVTYSDFIVYAVEYVPPTQTPVP